MICPKSVSLDLLKGLNFFQGFLLAMHFVRLKNRNFVAKEEN